MQIDVLSFALGLTAGTVIAWLSIFMSEQRKEKYKQREADMVQRLAKVLKKKEEEENGRIL